MWRGGRAAALLRPERGGAGFRPVSEVATTSFRNGESAILRSRFYSSEAGDKVRSPADAALGQVPKVRIRRLARFAPCH